MFVLTLLVIFQFMELCISVPITDDAGCEHKGNLFNCTIIPKDLPITVTYVYLDYEIGIRKTHLIKQGDFSGLHWKNVTFLQIKNSAGIEPYAMRNLTNLKELIIVGDRFHSLQSNSFAGLNQLNVLRLNALKQLNMIHIKNALSDALPNLEVFSLADMVLSDITLSILLRRRGRKFCRLVHGKCIGKNSLMKIDPENMKSCKRQLSAVSNLVVVMASKPLKSLDMYGIIMEDAAFALISLAMKNYRNINVTVSKFHNVDFLLFKEYYINILLHNPEHFVNCLANLVSYNKKQVNIRKNILNTTTSIFDTSYVSSPGVDEYIQYVLTLHNTSHTVVQDLIPGISTAEIINMTSINGCHRKISLKNLTVNIKSYLGTNSPTRELILRNNDLSHLDVKFKCNESNLEILDLSSNDIEFVQPEMCPCCFKLKELNISKNRLFKMANTYFTLFGRIFSSYPNLRKLFLSSNQLTTIPVEIFNDTMYLELIDLSNNILTNVNFNINHLINLKILDLKRNRISILDPISLASFNLVLQSNKTLPNVSRIILINENPILCSECEHLPFIKWIAGTSLIDPDGNKIICKSHTGNYIPSDDSAVNQLQEECDKPKRIRKIVILSTMIPLATTALTAIFSYIWLRYRRQMLRRKNIEEKIELIQQNQLETRYVVFLSYSSEDTDFLNEYVYNPLKIHLQEKIQTDRDIICLGDKHFQLGKPINDEMVRCLQQSAVILLLVSRNFCKSEFCRMEFDHALFLKKKFILMVKGEIDVNEMVPSLQEIFNRNTRLLWERVENIYFMKTTWDNVCSSILDLVP